MTDRVIVINPNSTEVVTEAMDRALDPLRLEGGPEIESVTNPDGPPGIENQQHVDQVSAHICRIIQARDNDAGAFAAFRTTVGVSNVRGDFSLPPRYRTASPKSLGFCELAARLCALRAT